MAWSVYERYEKEIWKLLYRNPVHAGTYRKKYIRDYEQEYYERCKELNANVYITVGGEEESGFVSGIESFEKFLEERNYDGLNIIYEIIEGYGHDTVFKPSIRNALEIFYGKSDVGR